MTTITVNLKIEGIHNWPQAKELLPEVAFLSDPHRHIFWFEVEKAVTHDDRDVEIILFKREIESYLKQVYGSPCSFGSKSCEMLAKEIVQRFECERVTVLEDGENGATYYRED